MSTVKWTLFLAILPTGCGAGDAGDDFSNNLFTDLGPLLALFGERVTMQFMSQSMGWLDNIILAMAPLGIMTIIVSAIRVGGPSWLKSIIGRGRENLAAAEVELMSSTSNEVCELWNGHEIVRCMGSAPITEFICLLPRNSKRNENPTIKTIEFKDAIGKKLLEDMDEKPWLYRHGLKQQDRNINSHNSKAEEGQVESDPSYSEIYVTRNTNDGAPNISLNSHRQLHALEFYIFAVLGIMIQVLVVWYACHATYYLKYPKDGMTIKRYAAPCTVIGTGFLVIGLLLCSHVVESSTEEKRYQACPDRELRIIWLQKTQTVSDQAFNSSAIFAKEEQRFITTSRRGNEAGHATTLAVKTVSGTIVSICGFVVQFVGLRQMHWSVSVVQLGAVLAMTGVRAWVRRGVATPPMCQRLTADFELDWLALALSDIENTPWRKDSTTFEGKDPMTMCMETSVPQKKRTWISADAEVPSEAQLIMIARRDLGHLAGWRGSATAEAISVAKAIEITMDTLFRTKKFRWNSWSLQTKHGKHVQFQLKYGNGKWKAYSNEIEAALSLWLFSVHQNESAEKDEERKSETFDPNDDGWLRTTGELATRSLRIHGWSTQSSLLRDMSWWLPSRKTRFMKAEEYVYGELEVKSHRVIGGDSSREIERRPEAAREPGEYIQFTSSGMIELDDFGNLSNKPRNEQCQVVTESRSILKSLYALDIFSAFMWAAAKTLDVPIEQDAEILPSAASSENAWRSFTLRSSRLSNMARDIESTGLGSLEEVYLSIIPPLSAEQKLPQVQAIIELVREHTKQHEEQQRSGDATEKYEWLGQLAQTFPVTSMFAIKATAVLVEYLGRVMMAIEFAKNQRHPAVEMLSWSNFGLGGSNFGLGGSKFGLEMELDHADCETVSRLKHEYKWYELSRKGPSMLKGQSSVTEDEFDLEYGDRLENVQDEENWRDDFERTALHYKAILGRWYLAAPHEGYINVADLSGWTALHYACLWGRVDMVRFLVGQNAAIEARSRDGEAPLHCAATNQDTRIVSFLVSAGATVDVTDARGSTPLHWALNKGHECVVKYLWPHANKGLRDRQGRTALHYAVNAGRLCPTDLPDWKSNVDINAKDTWNWTPLHLAAASGHEAVVRQLHDMGADIEAREEKGQTPIYLATKNGHEAATKLLVELGANVSVESLSGSTLLHSTAEGGNAAMAELLIDKGVKIDGNRDEVAIMDGIIKRYYESEGTPLQIAAKGGHEAMARLLITKGANIEVEDRDKKTPLHLAASGGHEAVARLLITKGANIEAEDHDGRTPLHVATNCMIGTPLPVAASGGHEAIARLLITKGANIEAEDCEGSTPLHLAARHRHEAIARLLITKGANIEAQNCEGSTPLHTAASDGHVLIAKLLIENGAVIDAKDCWDREPLHVAGGELVVMLLIEKGADKDAKGHRGETLLRTAVGEGRRRIVRVLIANGAKMESENDESMTPLQVAVQRGEHEIAEQLIEAGANRQVRDKTGGTLLHMAAQDDSDQMARLLIQHGAGMDARDNKGQTPLHIAAIAGRQATIKLLLASGADKEARDNDGGTPLDRARRDGTAMLLEAAIQIDKKRSL